MICTSVMSRRKIFGAETALFATTLVDIPRFSKLRQHRGGGFIQRATPCNAHDRPWPSCIGQVDIEGNRFGLDQRGVVDVQLGKSIVMIGKVINKAVDRFLDLELDDHDRAHRD